MVSFTWFGTKYTNWGTLSLLMSESSSSPGTIL